MWDQISAQPDRNGCIHLLPCRLDVPINTSLNKSCQPQIYNLKYGYQLA